MTISNSRATVRSVDELSTQHRPDADILRDPETQALRAKLALYLPALKMQAGEKTLVHLPSYVRSSVVTLLSSLDRWEADERSARA